MSKAVAKKQETKVTVSEADLGEWGDSQDVSSQDIMISKILPMQGMSKMVTERKASIGDLVDSVTGDKLGTIDEQLEFIPFHVEKLWLVQREVDGKMTYQGMEAITRENEDRKWEQIENGVKYRYDYNFRYYVLLPKDVEAGCPTPYIISFRRTSVKAGKKLFTQMFVRNRQMKKTPASFVMNLAGSMQSNDKGTFVVLDVDKGREATNDEVMAALDMFKVLKHSEQHQVHDVEEAPAKKFVSDNAEF